MSSNRTFTRRYLELLLAAAAAWYAVSEWLGPVVVRQAWAAEGPFGFLSRWLPGRELHPVASYLETWERLSLEATAAFVPLAVATYLGLQVIRAIRTESQGTKEVGASTIRTSRCGRPLAGSEILKIALLFGLGAGLLEAYYIASRAFVLRRPIRNFLSVSQDSVWMVPLTDAGIFLTAGVLLLLVSRRWRSLARAELVGGSFSAVAVVAVLMPTQRIHLWACLILAAGVGVQAGRAVSLRWNAVSAQAGRWSAALAGIVLILAMGIRWSQGAFTGPAGGEDRVVSGALAERPNVVLIVFDTERASELSLYGYTRETSPELERLARRALVFDRAIAPSSWTYPSHASLFTGLSPTHLGFRRDRPLAGTVPPVAERLSSAGYRTGAFVANIWYCNDMWGFARGFEVYRDQPLSVAMAIESSWTGRSLARLLRERLLGNHQDLVRKNAEQVNSEFLSWRDGIGRQSYFAFLNYFDAHDPYLPPAPFDRRFTNGREALYWLSAGTSAGRYSDEERSQLQASYDNAIAYADHALGRLIEELRRRGDAKRTWLIITSDHGEHFGEHGRMEHDNTPYMPLIHVPLMIVPPEGRLSRTVRVRKPVSLVDVPSTIMEIVGQENRGTSLPLDERAGLAHTSMGDGADMPRDTIVSEWRDARSLVVGHLHYIRHASGEEELYDLSVDMMELRDLSGTNAYSGSLDDFRRYLRGRRLMPAAPLSGRF